MKIFTGNKNKPDIQVQSGCMYLLFDVQKNTPANNIVDFFGDGNYNTADKIEMNYVSNRGSETICNTSPILPLAIMATVNENEMLCEIDGTGKIVSCRFQIEVGIEGALELNSDAYLSVGMYFNDETNLKQYDIWCIDSPNRVTMAYKYLKLMLNQGEVKELDLFNVNLLALPKWIDTIELLHPNGQVVNLKEQEVEDISRGANEKAICYGTWEQHNVTINGVSVPYPKSFEVSKFTAGGAYYDILGASSASKIRMVMNQTTIVYYCEVIDLAKLGSAA